MSIHRMDRTEKGRLACLLAIGVLALAVHAAGAGKETRAAFGVFSGTSTSLGGKFIDMNSGGHTDNHYLPNFILGAYFQYDFNSDFALQLSGNFQNCTNEWSFHYWDRDESGRESVGAFSVSLNGIYFLSRSPMARFYFLAGAGFLAGSFENLGALIQLAFGPGVNLRLKRGSPTSFNLAAIAHPVLYSYGKARQAFYLKLQAGLEFELRGRAIGDGA